MIQKRCTPYLFKIMIVMTAMVLSTGMVLAGSLEPPASAVDGLGNPVPTTIEALNKTLLLQSSDPGIKRFVELDNGPALNPSTGTPIGGVLDLRTGLEWEQVPDEVPQFAIPPFSQVPRAHADALTHCDGLSLGGNTDWRLPERDELITMIDSDNPGGDPDLPPGFPLFNNIQPEPYWSATSNESDATRAWVVDLSNGNVVHTNKLTTLLAWCVRGG